MPGTSSSQNMEPSKDVASEAPIEDAASSLRAAALLTLKKSNKRRKVDSDHAQSSVLLTRAAVVDNSVQLDYGQDDGDTDISSSPLEKSSSLKQSPPSSKISEADMEDGQVREEGEISDSEETALKGAANAQSKVTTPLPTSKRRTPPTTSQDNKLPSSTLVPKAESSSHSLLDRISAVPPPSSKSPQRVEGTHEERSYFIDVEHVRPGLELNQAQYDTAKDIVLDLLGWGVTPEYLVDCGLSREIVFYVFSELNLRLPKNFNSEGIIPYTPSTLKSLLRVPDRGPSGLGFDSDTQRFLGHPSLPPKPSSSGEDYPGDVPKPTEPSTDAAGAAALHVMERQRRQELLARKAVQASRKIRNIDTATSSTSKFMDSDNKDVEMIPPAPSESVDDFLRTIEPVGSGKMDIDEVPGLDSASTHVDVAQQEDPIDRMVESPSNQTSFPLQAEEQPASSVASTLEQEFRRSSSSEDISGASNGQARRNGKRPVAADFVDFETGPRDRNGSGLKRKTGSFASINSMRRCVIDLSDSEGEKDGEDVQMKPFPGPSGSNRYSTPPSTFAAITTPEYRTMSPAALAAKELEIQKMRQMIAEREQGRRMKLLKLEAMSNFDNITVKQEEDSLVIPVTESPSTEYTVTPSTVSSTAAIDNNSMNHETLVTPSAEGQDAERFIDPGNQQAAIATENLESIPPAEAVDVDLRSSSSAQTTPDLSPHRQRPEERAQQLDMHEKDASTYISIFDSYPLLRIRPRPIFEREDGTIAMDHFSSSLSGPYSHYISYPSLSSFSSSASSFVSLLSALHPLRLATVSQLLDPYKRICQFEVPGGGFCRDSSCEDLHISRIAGTSTGPVIAEPSDQDTAKYLSRALPNLWTTAYGSSLSSRIMAELTDVRVNHPAITLEERVTRVFERLKPHPPTS
ncbi:hypothetical protein F5890DRAFT_1494893 [Lentinula detonsa]|uniref:Zinc-finger domain-containing protein n=1 Tax=Lentinula detonsa TaxID=2804962 RepID=A0AA38UV23_9AGAR|nr:hypothetical protein F5890DRAFT_1494893 [Lentinula detonsa]